MGQENINKEGVGYMVIKIYVHDKLKEVCTNEFVAMNNVFTYRNIHGKENVRVERIEQDFSEAIKEIEFE